MKKKLLILSLLALLAFPTSALAFTRVSCGNITGIPDKIPYVVSSIVMIVEIAVPVVLVIVGSIDLLKGLAAQKEDEIKKGQQVLIKKLIVAGILFFVIAIVKFLISIVADNTSSANISSCIDCFINNKCDSSSKPTNPDMYNPMKYNSGSKVTVKSASERLQRIYDNYLSNSISAMESSTNSPSRAPKNNNTSTGNNNSNTGSNTGTSTNTNKNLFIGDSRTVGMCKTYSLCENSEYIAEIGKGYSWFKDTALKSASSKVTSGGYNIIILMGVNDAGQSGSQAATNYFSTVSSLAQNDWKSNKIIFVSVNPVKDGKSAAYTSGVTSFNNTMKSKIASSGLANLKYCDTYSIVNMSTDDSGDGLHYNKNGYSKIYSQIKKICI